MVSKLKSEPIRFSVEATDPLSKARAGIIKTAHSEALTPVFMPVATQGVVRGHPLTTLDALGYRLLLTNTYHLLLRPGADLLKSKDGLRGFSKWPHGFLSDSGGFQLFSLSHSLKVTEEGALFTSYIDGKKVMLTPEASIAMQGAIGSDIMMVLDQCLPSLSAREPMEKALHLTHRWAQRSFDARNNDAQALFGIVQGGCFLDLRKLSAELITSIPFDGFAVGGVAVGEEKGVREEILDCTVGLLPANKPRYLMGVGTPSDILEGVARGIDMFDCILPTALAEHGKVFTYSGRLNLLRGVYAGDDLPIDASCDCATCKTYSRGYLHHLMKADEQVAHSMLGLHNLTFYRRLMGDIRVAICAGKFDSFYREYSQSLDARDPEHPVVQSKTKRRREKKFIGDYEVVTREGYGAVKHTVSGEVMHSVNNPVEEARALYLDQSKIIERVKADPDSRVCLWDVGLGAATNVMSVIHAYEGYEKAGEELAPLEIVSFESSLDSLRLALRNPTLFSYLQHAAPYKLERERSWVSETGKIKWVLHYGDFRRLMKGVRKPDVIFYDPFSYKTNPEMWSLETLGDLFKEVEGSECLLLTYSASTRVRAAFLAAGFWVGYGVKSGPKESTTIALSQRPGMETVKLLGHEWLATWERSDSRYAVGLLEEKKADFCEVVRKHRQF